MCKRKETTDMNIKSSHIAAVALLVAGILSPQVVADTPYNAPQRVILRAANDNAEALQKALASGLNINATDDDYETALMKAADDGRKTAVRNLIAAGADVNLQDEDGETALMKAADEGHADIVQQLINAGANVNLRNDEGETALQKARQERHRRVVEILQQAGAR